jgi:hypothetical protein
MVVFTTPLKLFHTYTHSYCFLNHIINTHFNNKYIKIIKFLFHRPLELSSEKITSNADRIF